MWTGRTPWHIDGQNPLACRRRQLQGCWRRILACRQTPSFWHIDDHSVGISTETVFFGMSTENCFFACRREQSFLHVDGDNLVWHVDGDNLFCMSTETILFWHIDGDNPFGMSTETISFGMSTGTFFCMSTEAIFFACQTILFGMSTETIFFACGRRQSCFGMLTGTTLLACRRSFWHVDASYPNIYPINHPVL